MKQWKAIVSVLFVFLLGALAGALVTHKIYQQKMENIIRDEPRTMREVIVQRLNHALHLDATQLEQLRTIVKETRSEMKDLRKQIKPQMEEVLDRSQSEVREILHPDQLEKYDQIISERKKRKDNNEHSN